MIFPLEINIFYKFLRERKCQGPKIDHGQIEIVEVRRNNEHFARCDYIAEINIRNETEENRQLRYHREGGDGRS